LTLRRAEAIIRKLPANRGEVMDDEIKDDRKRTSTRINARHRHQLAEAVMEHAERLCRERPVSNEAADSQAAPGILTGEEVRSVMLMLLERREVRGATDEEMNDVCNEIARYKLHGCLADLVFARRLLVDLDGGKLRFWSSRCSNGYDHPDDAKEAIRKTEEASDYCEDPEEVRRTPLGAVQARATSEPPDPDGSDQGPTPAACEAVKREETNMVEVSEVSLYNWIGGDEVTTYKITAEGWTPQKIASGLKDRSVEVVGDGLRCDGKRIADQVDYEVTVSEWSPEYVVLEAMED
jgi:hypothetical protein